MGSKLKWDLGLKWHLVHIKIYFTNIILQISEKIEFCIFEEDCIAEVKETIALFNIKF